MASRFEQSDVGRLLHVLERFAPKGRRSMVTIGGLSFVSGLSEAGVLVMVTSVALAATQSESRVALGPLSPTLREVLLAALALLALNLGLNGVLARSVANTSTEASLAARRALLDAFHQSTYQRKSQDRVAALQEALTTYVDRFTNGFSSLTTFFTAALNLASFGLAALVVSPTAAIALSAIGVVLVVVLRPAARRTRHAAHALALQRRRYAEGATESVLLAREHSVFGTSEVAGQRLRAVDTAVGADFWRLRFLVTLTPRVYQALTFALAVLGLFVLTGVDIDNLASIGAVVLLVVRSLSYGQQMLTGLHQIAEHRPYVDQLMEMLESYEADPGTVGTVSVGPFRELELRSVAFSYDDGSAALRQVDLVISAGETIGVVGPSGAGKTTFVNLLLRLYRPTEGRLLINDVDLSEVLDSEWHRRTAIVPQEPRLIHGSISDNIRFLRDIDDVDIVRAARDANIAEFIESLPLGYDAQVGELGTGLSGGQRQRICIARALAGHPDLLVLDEPTSALDGESEAAIQATLQSLRGSVTMLIVAHRLSTLTICDRLILLHSGTLAASGTAAELEVTSSYYRDAMKFAGL